MRHNLKTRFIEWLNANGYTAKDFRTHSEERCDAFDFAKKMAEEFGSNAAQSGILIRGTG